MVIYISSKAIFSWNNLYLEYYKWAYLNNILCLPKVQIRISNYGTTALISQASKVMLKISKPGFNSTGTENFQMFKLDLEKAEEPEIKLPTSAGSSKKQESSRKTSILLYWLHQSFWLCGSQQTVENFYTDGNTRPFDLPPEKSACSSRSNS